MCKAFFATIFAVIFVSVAAAQQIPPIGIIDFADDRNPEAVEL